MYQMFRLFEKAGRVALSLKCAAPVLLFGVITLFAVEAPAQSVAASVIQSNQKSDTSSIATPTKGSGGMLGVYVGDINEARAKELKLAEARGAVIGKVEEGSPAAKAGLQEHDVILAFDDHQIYNPSQLYRFLTETSAGVVVTLGISRDGASQSLRVTLGQSRAGRRGQGENVYATADAHLAAANERVKEAEEARQRGDLKEAAQLEAEAKDFRKLADESRSSVDKDIREGRLQPALSSKRLNNNVAAARYQLGVRVAPLNEQLAAFFNVRNGVLVNEVRVGGVAEIAGVKAGDCIVAVNDERVGTLADLNNLVDRANDKGSTATLSIVRDRKELAVEVKFGSKSGQQ